MEIRNAQPTDLNTLLEIDGTVESTQYLHVDRAGEGLETQWRLQERPLRERKVDRNRPTDEQQFLLKQVVQSIDDGIALLAEHDGQMVGLLLAQTQAEFGTLHVVDLRIDFDMRRQGLATAMMYQAIAEARQRSLRAVKVECDTSNVPANRLFAKLGFALAGIDTHRRSNHDLVKESAALFWYAALD